MSESSTGGSYGKAGFTRRRFIIGTAGVSAMAALGGTVVRAPRAVASGAPSGPPTATLPLPTSTKPEQLLLTWGGTSANQVPGAGISLLLGGPVAPLVSATVFGSPAAV